MSSKKEIIKDVGLYAFATYLTQAIDIVISVVMKRLLGPTFSGVWASLQVILIYAKHINLGTTDASYREIPYLMGKGEVKQAEMIKNTVFWFAFINAVILSVGIIGYALIFRSKLSAPVFWGLITIAILVVLQRVYNFFVVLLRAFKNFTLASKVMVFSSAAGALPLLFFTWKFKIYGYFAATLLIFSMNIIFIQLNQHYRFPWTLSWERLKPLIIFGFSIMVLGMVDSVFRSIDRIVIPKFMGFEQMGFYSLAIMATNYLTSFPNMLNVVLFPHFQEKFSKRDKPEDLKNFVMHSTIALGYLFPFLLGACWIFAELLVAWILPQFRPGIFPLKILAVGVFFICLNQQFSILLITIKKHVIMIPIIAVLAALSGFMQYLAIKNGYGLPGCAIVMSVSYFIYFMVYFRLASRHVMSKGEAFQLLARIMGIFIYFVALLLVIDFVIPAPKSVLLRTLMRYAIFATALMPFMFHLNKETRMWSHLKEMFLERIQKRKKGEEPDLLPPNGPNGIS
ncbi:MAG: oligosaccharide flippase family protein [Candidatus Omnitrophica bacterium]|nr:oligosaccharide flippase family protein [Candidatus Omnitrophota bacterium]